MIEKYAFCANIRHVGVVGSISTLILGKAWLKASKWEGLMAIGIDVWFIFIFIFVTWLEINKILSTRQINSNTHQCAATIKFFYISIYIALCLTDSQRSVSLKVLGYIIRHKILRMLEFHPITGFVKTYPNFKNYFWLGFFCLNIFSIYI